MIGPKVSKADPPQSTPTAVDSQASWVDQRKTFGMVIGGVGMFIILAAGGLALNHLWSEKIDKNATRSALWIFSVKLGAEAVVAVALVYFGYQLLRAGERMLMPHWWVTAGQIDVLRAMLGIDSPVDGAVKGISKLTDAVDEIRKDRSRPS